LQFQVAKGRKLFIKTTLPKGWLSISSLTSSALPPDHTFGTARNCAPEALEGQSMASHGILAIWDLKEGILATKSNNL